MELLCKRCGQLMVIQNIGIGDKEKTIKMFCHNRRCDNRITVHSNPLQKEQNIKAHYA